MFDSKSTEDHVTVSVRAPASLSNLGPGFDTLGVAVTGPGDVVHMSRAASEVTVRVSGDRSIPLDPGLNTATVAALEVFRLAGYTGGANVVIEKDIPYGSGLGGSAASAAAGAAAANLMLGEPLDELALVACALAGEAIASKSVHGDNVIPALIGGAVLVDANAPHNFRRLQSGVPLYFAIIIPDLRIQTAGARSSLPKYVDFRAAVGNASALAMLVHAIGSGDVEAIAALIMRDAIVEPLRAANIPCYDAVRAAALAAGAGGCAISGSGPTMFSVAGSYQQAETIAKAMAKACRDAEIHCEHLVSEIDHSGTRLIGPTSERRREIQ